MFNKILISKANLLNNLSLIKQNNPDSKLCAMVKANAYGVGIKEVVKIIDSGVDFYGVSSRDEAVKLARLTKRPILVVGTTDRFDCHFSYSCMNLGDVNTAIALKMPINVHLKINTGMNRYGFKNIKDFELAINKIKNSLVNLQGVFTHFATDDKLVLKQNNKFKKYIKLLNEYNLHPIIHADNSIANFKFNHGYDMVRVGFNLYNCNSYGFKPVVEILSKIVAINDVKSGELVGYNYRFVANKRLRVAVIPIGYADGFDMHFLGLKLKVGEVECQVLNICMDCFMLDISNLGLKVGDEIAILNKENPLEKYAKYARTSEYEIMTKFSFMRAKRIIK